MATTRPSRKRSPRWPSASNCRNLVTQLLRSMKRRTEQILGHIGLVGKIDPRFDQRQRFDQTPPPSLGTVADQALELPKRLPALGRRLRRNQISQPFHRREIKPAVLEGTAGEFARLGRPAARNLPQRIEYPGNHRLTAMNLQLGRILAGLAVRRRKPQRQAPRRSPRRSPDRAAAPAPPCAAPERAQSASRARSRACGPETRTTAIAAGGRPEDKAKMVGTITHSLRSEPLDTCSASRHAGYLLRCAPCQRHRKPPPRTKTVSPTRPAPISCSIRIIRSIGGPGDRRRWPQAKQNNKPILLSVGYAACHWCHVMAHESFEDDATARVMNELFVNIKVDREERPDIDQIYMAALHHLGRAWRLAADHVSDAGRRTDLGRHLFSKNLALRQTGLRRCAARNRAAVPRRAAKDRAKPRGADGAACRHGARHRHGHDRHRRDSNSAARQLGGIIDPVNGGTRGAPKFPQAALFELLWRAGLRTGEARYFAAVEITLDHICEGGIYDHLGGGFSRYSVDERWLVPHFEKMLYDNAQLLELLAIAHQRSGKAALPAARAAKRLPGSSAK